MPIDRQNRLKRSSVTRKNKRALASFHLAHLVEGRVAKMMMTIALHIS